MLSTHEPNPSLPAAAATPSSQQSDTFHLSESFENQLNLEPRNVGKKPAAHKLEREFGRELTNDQSTAQTAQIDSKVSILMRESKLQQIGPSKQNQSHMQPPCKFIDSDTKNCHNEDPLFKTQSVFKLTSAVEDESSVVSETTKDVSDLPVKSHQSVSNQFKERLLTYKKRITKDMTFADQLDMRDPQCVTEVANDIFSNLRRQENGFQL